MTAPPLHEDRRTDAPHAPRTPARPGDPRWARPGLLLLLAVTAALYLWDLGASGYANSFYSAAVQAGSESWKAFFFGSSDAANSITVDKPPAALWPMGLSVRLFGLGAWQILVPEALMGVAAVGVLYATVRRRFGAGAGLLAGGVLAVTPVAALMFRFNNPDALLCLLMVCAIACVLRALEDARTKWLVLAGLCFGFAFLVKTLQAWLILPPLALVYLLCAPTTVRRRIGQTLLAGLALVVSAGWWVAIVELWPASSRPYIGGSQNNSFLELTFGYNGLGRINGNETGSVGGGGGGRGGGGWGETGIGRLFSSDMGGQISWLLPAAFLLLIAGLAVLWRARRATDAVAAQQRNAFRVWGGALLMTFVTFSFMSGIFHQYYNVALAPYVAALVGMGAALLWQRRGHVAATSVLALTVAVTAVWSYVLLDRSPSWLPWLRWAVLVGGLFAAVALAVFGRGTSGAGRRLAVGAAGLGLVTSLAGPVAYTLNTVTTPHTGSIITAGPSVAGGMGGPGGMGGGRPGGGKGGPPGMPGAQGNAKAGPGGQPPGGMKAFPGGSNQWPGPGGTKQQAGPGRAGGERGAMRGAGGMGGLLNGAQVSTEVKAELLADADEYTWAAASIGSQNAASYQLATGRPVMAVGGFNGSDPSPTLKQFQQYVKEGRIHYFLGGGMGGPGGSSGTSARITSWVAKNFEKVTVGSTTLYDLTSPKK
ncbi:glycosyl transferase [Streptomyces sp. Ru73]|uniref:glycosyltransferase family 39 protein n=1 Tax=Streptomyces sp. Ru73 TaxID=2080748 RepID=UPI000CDE09B3|nr:glycosyltransferase family 39 protein [Streptomyces sp. Ru73]POX37813.1 glycosyl transferase [Streptomyces sp. Ru73]